MSDQLHRPMNTFCGRTRREFLWQAGGAFTSVALAGMLAKDGFLGKQALAFDGTTPLVKPSGNPLGAKPSMLPGKAKSVIFVFCYGGPSHIDTYDYKPDLFKYDGQTVKVKTYGQAANGAVGGMVDSAGVAYKGAKKSLVGMVTGKKD